MHNHQRQQAAAGGKPPAAPGKFEKTRLKLVSAIRAEIRASGDFNAEQVARRSKSSAANFYNHFGTKDAALAAAYEQMMGELEALLAQQCSIETLLDEGMAPFMANWVLRSAAFFAEHAALFRLTQAGFGRSKVLRDLFRKYEASIIEIYRRFIELGQAANLIRAGDQLTMARMLVVFSESWHHSLVQKLTPGDTLHDELTLALVKILEPNS